MWRERVEKKGRIVRVDVSYEVAGIKFWWDLWDLDKKLAIETPLSKFYFRNHITPPFFISKRAEASQHVRGAEGRSAFQGSPKVRAWVRPLLNFPFPDCDSCVFFS